MRKNKIFKDFEIKYSKFLPFFIPIDDLCVHTILILHGITDWNVREYYFKELMERDEEMLARGERVGFCCVGSDISHLF